MSKRETFMNTVESNSNTDHAQGLLQYLTFTLGDDEFGVPILRVREIIGLLPITPVPDAPYCIRGVLNLRGRMVPVMDLRRRFQFDGDSATLERSCVIVIEIERDDRMVDIGLLVDTVQEVFNFNLSDINQSKDYRATVDPGCIEGIANSESGIKILIDVDLLLSDSQLGSPVMAGSNQVQESNSWDLN